MEAFFLFNNIEQWANGKPPTLGVGHHGSSSLSCSTKSIV